MMKKQDALAAAFALGRYIVLARRDSTLDRSEAGFRAIGDASTNRMIDAAYKLGYIQNRDNKVVLTTIGKAAMLETMR